MSTGWSWGFDHLHRLGSIPTAGFLLLGLALVLPRTERASERVLDSVGRSLDRGGNRLPIVLALFGVALFAAFPIGTRIYGDSLYILDDYSTESLSVHLKEMIRIGLAARGRGSFILHDLIARSAGLSLERSYIIVSVVCGGIFLLAHARLAATLPGITRSARGAILWIGLVDGANQLFFGHIENYTVSRLFGSLFLIGVIRSLFDPKPTRGRNLPILWFLLAVFFHGQILVLLPTLLLWSARRLAERKPRFVILSGGKAAGAGLAIAIVSLAAAYFTTGAGCYDYIYSGGHPSLRQVFLPISTRCVGEPFLRYTLFSGAHMLDLLGSLFSISSPAVLLVIMVLVAGARHDSRLWLLLPSIATASLHNFILNPAIGFPFDWDLMCVLSLPLLYTAVFLLARVDRFPRRFVPALLLLGLGTATLFGINADRKLVRQRVEDMGVWLHRTYYGGSHYRLSANMSSLDDPVQEIRERRRLCERITPQAYVDDREVAFLWERLATRYIEHEDWEDALAAYRMALEIQPSRWDRKKATGYLETEVGNLADGISLLRDYLDRAPNDGEAWLFLGDGQARRGETDQARSAWIRFLELTPNAPEGPRVREDLRRMAAPGDEP